MTPEASALAAANVRVVYAIANEQRRRRGGGVDDLIGDGMVGLCQAAEQFDPSRFEGTFSTYARHRIMGAMADGRRRQRHQDTGWTRRRPTDLVTVVSSEGAWTFEEGPRWVEEAPSAEHVALDRFGLASLLEAVNELKPTHRDALLAAADGEPLNEYAAKQCVSADLISYRLGAARERMRSWSTGDGFVPTKRCRNGHDVTADSCYVDSAGYHRCRVCRTNRDSARRGVAAA